MERRRLVATLALLALVALAGCETAPPRETVCSGCTTMPERTDNVTVDDSVTHIYVDSEGDARVEARMRLSGSGVDSLRNNRTELQTLVGRIDEGYGLSAFERRNLTGRMDGDTLVVTYRAADVGQRRLGMVVVDAFYRYDGGERDNSNNYEYPYLLSTDRLVVHGPDGTRSLVDPAKGTSGGDSVTWTGDEISTRTYLVFGQHGPLATLAIALETLSWAVEPAVGLALFMSLPLVSLACVFAAYYPARLDGGWSPSGDRLFGALCCLGGLFMGMLGGLIGILLSLGILAVVLWRYRPYDGVLATVRRFLKSVLRTVLTSETAVERRMSVAISTVFAAATAVVATDYRATLTHLVVLVVALVLPASFTVLGRLVTEPHRSVARVAVVTTIAGTVWLFAFAATVQSGAAGTVDLLVALLIFGCLLFCPPLFYGALWRATR